MNGDDLPSRSALNSFFSYNEARKRAHIESLTALLTRRSNSLVPLSIVRSYMAGSAEEYLGLRTVRINRILGSEQRSNDFSPGFAPKKEAGRFRWMSVHSAFKEKGGLPAISLYELGGVYFVRDGHHRVSVARQEGAQFIEAEVTRIPGDLVLDPSLDEHGIFLRLMSLLEDKFVRVTGLTTGKPFQRPSNPEGWNALVAEIEKHRLFLSESVQTADFRAAANSWLSTVYAPFLGLAKKMRLAWYFPGQNPTDLYLTVARMESRFETERNACLDGQDLAGTIIRDKSLQLPVWLRNLVNWLRGASGAAR